jgi:hypothetical protein
MKMQQIREIAKKKSVIPGKMSKTELIKSIQRAEGNIDCFAGQKASSCDQQHCLWREDCAVAVA